jgi:K+ transporter
VSSTKSSLAALTLGAIGVVYGDIGTSVLYAMKEVFGSGHVPFTPDNVHGILSIFFWTLTTIVSVKYVVLVLKADNHGEGGLVAMLALASQSVRDRPELRKILLIVGIFGTCLFYGDGVITPAISVLSAVEGLEVVSPAFTKSVIPLTLVILLALFWVQKRGTAGIGKFFGPITLVWFGVIALLGVSHIAHHPQILWAISPHYALNFIWQHTSETDTGQIYMPFVNWGLFVAIVLAVGMFRSSSNLAAAYGIAVCTDMLITTVLTFFVIRYAWKLPLALCIGATGFFCVVDVAVWASNTLKLLDGGWFPLVIGGAVFLLMLTWYDGRRLLNESMRADALHLPDFLEAVFIAPPTRVDGTAVFMTAETGVVPNALLHNLKHNKVLHQQNLFVTVRSHEVPRIAEGQRLDVTALGHDCWQVIVNIGFKDEPNLPKALAELQGVTYPLDAMNTSYFLSRDIVIPTIGGGMAPWREKLFAQMHHNASAAAEFLNLPTNAVVELGSKIEI